MSSLLNRTPKFFSVTVFAVLAGAVFADDFDLDSILKGSESAVSNIDVSDIQGTQLSDEAYKWANEIVNSSKSQLTINNAAVNEVLGIDDSSIQTDTNRKHIDDDVVEADRYVDVYVSRSLTDAVIRGIAEVVNESPVPARLVFQGVPTGTKINDTMDDIARWSQGFDRPVPAIIDPNLFTENSVSQVPYLVLIENGEKIASVSGIANPIWIAEAVDNGKTGHLGTQGQTMSISEPNLIDVMMQRYAEYQFKKKPEEYVSEYWNTAMLYPMLPAEQDGYYYIDPTITLNEDMVDPSGNIVLPAGSQVNPLQAKPFTRKLIVFNPNRKSEVEWVKEMMGQSDLKEILIVTELDRKRGWEQLDELNEIAGEQVYMMTQDILNTFHIERTPSTVVSDGYYFRVDEFGLNKQEAK